MSGFYRKAMPQALDRAALSCVVVDFIREQEIAEALAAQDPFGIDHDCRNPAGHDFIGSCGQVVCPHCARIFG